MPERDPTRDLVRRAYDDISDFDADSGLADVVRRAGRPRPEAGDATTVALEPRRTVRRFAVAGTFAAAVVTILAVYAASAGTRPDRVGAPPSLSAPASSRAGSDLPASAYPSGRATPTNPSTSTYAASPGASRNAGNDPQVLPSSCADSWVMALTGDRFVVSSQEGSGCPPLPLDRLWVLDAASGNGLINPGDAVIWPVVPVDGARSPVRPPLKFRPGGDWPGPQPGHYYVIIYVSAAAATQAKPGEDSYAAFLGSYNISGRVIA